MSVRKEPKFMNGNLIELQNVLRSNGILISFSGRLSQGIIEELGDALKKHMEAEDRPKTDIFNVFAIFIEQTQNIKNYIVRKSKHNEYDKIANSGIISIVKQDSGYTIWSGNLIENSDIEPLKQKLNMITGLSKDELKRMYKEQLKKDIPSDSLGAGVGLIDIARKASNPIQYIIHPVDNEFSFYELKVKV